MRSFLQHENASLRLSFPLGKTLLLSVPVLLLIVAVAEAVARLPWFETHVPMAIGSSNQYFDAKVGELDFLVEQKGGVDCIFLGSSTVRNGINPTAFVQAYRQQTHQGIVCYNFGIPGIQADMAATLAKFLVKRYHPRLLIYGIEVRSLRPLESPIASVYRSIMDTPWMRYQGGHFTVDGWLVAHVRVYRNYLAVRHWPDPKFPIPIRDLSHPLRDGYTPITIPDRFYPLDYLETFTISEPQWDSLPAIFGLHTDTQVLLVEVPINPQALAIFRGGSENYRRVVAQIVDYAAQYGIPMWTPPPDLIPADGWVGDPHHMNGRGATVYSTWLGNQVGAAVSGHQIPDPTNGRADTHEQ